MSSYSVNVTTDIVYAEGLSHHKSSTSPFPIPLKLDVYYPDNNSTNRPVFMFIHGGGFTGGMAGLAAGQIAGNLIEQERRRRNTVENQLENPQL